MIAIGSDHAGFSLKSHICAFFDSKGIPYRDFGTHSQESCHYPEIAAAVARSVARGECEKGILVCGTGIGMSIAANKIPGVRAAACSDSFSARHCRLHNDANILCIGERVVGPGLALELVGIFLSTAFDTQNHRHKVRVDMITSLERGTK